MQEVESDGESSSGDSSSEESVESNATVPPIVPAEIPATTSHRTAHELVGNFATTYKQTTGFGPTLHPNKPSDMEMGHFLREWDWDAPINPVTGAHYTRAQMLGSPLGLDRQRFILPNQTQQYIVALHRQQSMQLKYEGLLMKVRCVPAYFMFALIPSHHHPVYIFNALQKVNELLVVEGQEATDNLFRMALPIIMAAMERRRVQGYLEGRCRGTDFWMGSAGTGTGAVDSLLT